MGLAMVEFLLDTCVFVNLFHNRREAQEKVDKLGINSCCTAEICRAELYAGAYKTGKEVSFRQVEWIESQMPVLPFSFSGKTYGRLRSYLETMGARIEDMDLLLASIAIDNSLTLVTHNRRHLDRIPGLKLEVWD